MLLWHESQHDHSFCLQDKEAVALDLEDSQQQVTALQQDLAAAAEERQALQGHMRRRLAVLRWHRAAAAVLMPRQTATARPQSAAQHAAAAGDGPAAEPLQQVAALEASAAAVVEARQQRQEHRRRGQAETALAAVLGAPGSRAGSSSGGTRGMHAMPHGPSRLRSGISGSQVARPEAPVPPPPLRCLRPEAQAALLLSLSLQQRQQALAGMSDAERAALVLHWDEPTRSQVALAADCVPPRLDWGARTCCADVR